MEIGVVFHTFLFTRFYGVRRNVWKNGVFTRFWNVGKLHFSHVFTRGKKTCEKRHATPFVYCINKFLQLNNSLFNIVNRIDNLEQVLPWIENLDLFCSYLNFSYPSFISTPEVLFLKYPFNSSSKPWNQYNKSFYTFTPEGLDDKILNIKFTNSK